jgi:hypothetical protein
MTRTLLESCEHVSLSLRRVRAASPPLLQGKGGVGRREDEQCAGLLARCSSSHVPRRCASVRTGRTRRTCVRPPSEVASAFTHSQQPPLDDPLPGGEAQTEPFAAPCCLRSLYGHYSSDLTDSLAQHTQPHQHTCQAPLVVILDIVATSALRASHCCAARPSSAPSGSCAQHGPATWHRAHGQRAAASVRWQGLPRDATRQRPAPPRLALGCWPSAALRAAASSAGGQTCSIGTWQHLPLQAPTPAIARDVARVALAAHGREATSSAPATPPPQRSSAARKISASHPPATGAHACRPPLRPALRLTGKGKDQRPAIISPQLLHSPSARRRPQVERRSTRWMSASFTGPCSARAAAHDEVGGRLHARKGPCPGKEGEAQREPEEGEAVRVQSEGERDGSGGEAAARARHVTAHGPRAFAAAASASIPRHRSAAAGSHARLRMDCASMRGSRTRRMLRVAGSTALDESQPPPSTLAVRLSGALVLGAAQAATLSLRNCLCALAGCRSTASAAACSRVGRRRAGARAAEAKRRCG